MSGLHESQKYLIVDGVQLKVHKDYDPEKYIGCNGCGAGWNRALVPDTIYFVSITIACCPHDFRYELGGTLDDKHLADEEFLYNMISIVESVKKWYYPTSPARSRAMTYYSAVVSLGEEVFLANNKKEGVSDGSIDNCEDNSSVGVSVQRGSDNRAGERWSRDRKHRVLRSKFKRGV